MAARKTPNPRKSTTTPKKSPPKKTTGPGPTGKPTTAQQAITRQYGLVKNAEGQWVKPNMAFLERQLSAQGWGKSQTGVTPVMIGGMRFLTGMGKLEYTGQRSDAAKRNPGAAWAGNEGGAGSPGTFGGTAAIDPEKEWVKGISGASGEFITEQGESSLAAGEAETATTTTKKRKRPAKRPKKLVKKATGKKSPGGRKIVPKERKKIQAAKKQPLGKPKLAYKPSSRVTQRRKK